MFVSLIGSGSSRLPVVFGGDVPSPVGPRLFRGVWVLSPPVLVLRSGSTPGPDSGSQPPTPVPVEGRDESVRGKDRRLDPPERTIHRLFERVLNIESTLSVTETA